MANFDEKTIQETAYYIWKNNGCPGNSCASDWNSAIELLERKDALATANKISSMYRTASLLPDLKFTAKQAAAAKNISKMPYILAQAASKTVVSASSSKKASKKVAKKA